MVLIVFTGSDCHGPISAGSSGLFVGSKGVGGVLDVGLGFVRNLEEFLYLGFLALKASSDAKALHPEDKEAFQTPTSLSPKPSKRQAPVQGPQAKPSKIP